MSQAITVRLSDDLYEQVKQMAELSHQPTEVVIIQSLNHTLPPLFEDIPARYQQDVCPLLQMNDAELQHESQRTFQPERWIEYETLLDKKKMSKLTDEDEMRLDMLRREADVLMFRRSYASVLLKRRGYRIPLQEQAASR